MRTVVFVFLYSPAAVVFALGFPGLEDKTLCSLYSVIIPRASPRDFRQRKKKGRGGENAHARGGRGKKADVTLAMVTRVEKVTPEQAGFHHVRCTFIDPITGVRCGEIRLWNKKALKDLRPSGKGEWIAVVGAHQPRKNGVRLHSASFAPWRKTGKAVDGRHCLIGAKGAKYLADKNASVDIVSRHQTAYKEFLASET